MNYMSIYKILLKVNRSDIMDIDIFDAKNKLRAFRAANDVRKGDFKQVIVVNKSLGMSQGKLAAQVAHASTLSLLQSNDSVACGWLANSYPKIVLQVESTQDLLNLYNKAKDAKLPAALVIDEGRTEVINGSITCLGIGPETKNLIDEITGDLRLL